MDQQEIRSILEQASSGACTVDEAVLALKMEPFQDLGFAKIDRHRCLRQGGGSVVDIDNGFGAGCLASMINQL